MRLLKSCPWERRIEKLGGTGVRLGTQRCTGVGKGSRQKAIGTGLEDCGALSAS